MKKRSEIKTRGPPKIRSSSVRGFNGVRSNAESIDVIRAKRVKFMDPESDCHPNIRPNAPAVQHEPTEDSASAAPKTSEYAFFKKLRKDAGCSHSYTSHNEENQLKNCDLSGCSRGISNKLKDIYDDSRSSLLVEKVRPMTRNSFFSPHTHASTDSGTEYLDEVFSGKRKRLCQRVANTTLPNISEGCDLVSLLINRLLPETGEKKSCTDAEPVQMRASTKHSSHVFPEFHTYNRERHWTPGRDLLEAEHGWYLDDCPNESREIVPSKWDTKDSDSLSTSHAPENHSLKFSSDYEGGTASLITVHDPYFCSNLENYGSPASAHIKGLNEFQVLDESVNGREPCTLLLGWDFDDDNLKDQGLLPIPTRNAVMLNSTLAASWEGHQSLDNSYDASELYSSSFSFNYPLKFTSFLDTHSAHVYNQNVGCFLGDEKFLVAELKYFPLSLPCTPKDFNLREDCDTHNTCEDGSTIFPENHHRDVSKVFSEKHHPDLEAFLCPSRQVFDLGWRCLSMSSSIDELYSSTYDGSQSPFKESPCSYLLTKEQNEDWFYSSNLRQKITHFADDTLDRHDWSSINFHTHTDKEKAHPMLLDNSSWFTSEGDIHDDDDEGIYI